MADFRRWILAFAVLALVFTGLASAQTGTTGTGNLNCVAQSNPNQLRSEGYTEQTGDVVITCNGGAITYAVGQAIPTANITVYLNGTVTSRLLASGGVSEALLMIDDPGSGETAPVKGFGPAAPQITCSSTNGAQANGCGQEFYQLVDGNGVANAAGTPVAASTATVATTTTAFAPGPNVFQGVVSGGQVTFNGIPVLPPVSSGVDRVFRITNVRVNANGITGGGPVPANVTESFAISGPGAFTVQNNGLTTGYIQTSLSTSLRNAASSGGLSGSGFGALQCNSMPSSGSTPQAVAQLRYSELFGAAWKTRVTANGQVPVNQNIPGALYYSETGFYSGAFTGSYANAGLADYGTRVKAVFNNVPNGVNLYVTSVATGGTTSGTTAILITSETAPENGSLGAPAVPTTTTSNSGAKVVALQVVNGTATAVWEILSTSPNTNETLDFEVSVNYTASPANGVPPAPSTMTVNMSYAPTPPAFTASAGGAASQTLTIPRFADTSKAGNLFAVSICQTALLFPYVTNINGFDTGLAIANTTTDPFGTAAQAGICTIYWYQGGTNPPSRTLGNGGIDTTTPIASGTVQAILVSTTQAGFNGYVIAVCNFQFAHGFAFVSDLGARNLAMGYLALVINPSAPVNRGPATAESLAH